MSKENGFYCENTEHGHITEAEAIECYGRTKIEELEAAILRKGQTMKFFDHDIRLPRFRLINTPAIWFKRTHKEESDGFIFEYRLAWWTKKLYILEHYAKEPLI